MHVYNSVGGKIKLLKLCPPKEAMQKEMKNTTIRDEILKPLMTGTFNKRQLMIEEAPIAAVCAEYPPLRSLTL